MMGVVAVLWFFAIPKYAMAAKFQPRNDVRAIHPVAEKWVVDHDGACPTVEQLKAEKELSSSAKIDDPWGSPYRIECRAKSVSVSSLGPDGTADTADDIRYP